MALLGVTLTVLIGRSAPVPAPPALVESLDRVEVTTSDSGRSGFQITFAAGRSTLADLVDYPLLTSPLLFPSNRVVLVAGFGGRPSVLMDGVITHRELIPGSEPGTGTITITGGDVSAMMDLEQKTVEYPAQDETVIVTRLIADYAAYGLTPLVVPPPSIEPPLAIDRIPVQQGTDLSYLTELASRYGYVFYVQAGPAPLTNLAYWGPPIRVGPPQPALTVNMGAETNVERINFRHDALTPTVVTGHVQDRYTNRTLPVRSLATLRPPLAARPDWLVNQPAVRTTRFRDSGLSAIGALARAQGAADDSVDSLTATGTLDASRYGHLLTARGLVGVRGVGWQHDGFYYVKDVTHHLSRGEYTQDFTLTREGVGSTTPVVRP
ncbi:hypothetical protein ACH4OY_13780 [Micromonospora rubida]|uniref:Phage protein D n=1 Tax=Micromonospora rubida TaxID=2697657 RepID=A0ABW7SJ75_9ACTN